MLPKIGAQLAQNFSSTSLNMGELKEIGKNKVRSLYIQI
jgi:hypothetical protein